MSYNVKTWSNMQKCDKQLFLGQFFLYVYIYFQVSLFILSYHIIDWLINNNWSDSIFSIGTYGFNWVTYLEFIVYFKLEFWIFKIATYLMKTCFFTCMKFRGSVTLKIFAENKKISSNNKFNLIIKK